MTTAFQFTRYITNTLTKEVTEDPHGVILVGNGLNFKDPDTGAYLPTQDLITLMPDGSAAALQGVTKLRCGAALADGILLTTRSGRTMLTRPSEIFYVDKSTKGEVPLAKMNGEAKAEVLGLNRVLYRKALVSEFIEADLLITYTKSATESDIIIVKQPLLTPEDCGLSKEALLQVRSEWYNTPPPRISKRVVQRGADGDLEDQQIDMDGELWFPTGKVLSLDGNSPADASSAAQIDITGFAEGEGDVPVMKEWQQGEPSTLSESVPWKAIVDKIAKLPLMSRSRQQKETEEARLRTQNGRTELAALAKKPSGVAIDWIGVVSSSSSFTFNSYTNGNTYLITNSVAFTSPATVTFQSNCIVKLAPGTTLQLTGGLVCNGTTNHPSIITSRDDAAFGETTGLPGYTGCPSQLAAKGLWLNSQGNQYTISGMRIRYATNAIRFDSERGCTASCQNVNNCVIESCQTGLYVGFCCIVINSPGNAPCYVREVTTPGTYMNCSPYGSFITQTTLASHIVSQMQAVTNGHSPATGLELYTQAATYVYTNYNTNSWIYGLKGHTSVSVSNSLAGTNLYGTRQGAGTLITPRHAITISTNHGGTGKGWNFTGSTFRFIGKSGAHYTALCTSDVALTNFDIGVLTFQEPLTNDVEYVRVFPTNGYRKISSALGALDYNLCPARHVPSIQLSQFKLAYASDWWFIQPQNPLWVRAFDPSVWFPAWNYTTLPWDGDSGHPNFLVISDELILTGPLQAGSSRVLMQQATFGTAANTVNRWVGMKFTVGSVPISVLYLQRWSVNGVTNHYMKIVNTAGQLQGGHYASTYTNAVQNGFAAAYFTNGVPVTLTANTTYYLLSQETIGGEPWYGATGTTVSIPSGLVTCNGSVWSVDEPTYYASDDGQTFGPVGMVCRWGGYGEYSSRFISDLNAVLGPDYQVSEIDLSAFPDL